MTEKGSILSFQDLSLGLWRLPSEFCHDNTKNLRTMKIKGLQSQLN